MAKVTYKGTPPKDYIDQKLDQFVALLNQEALELERELVEATPSGVSGRLRSLWSVDYAIPKRVRAIVSNNSSYLLPVEMGRVPGKGISIEGQESVQLWAKRVLGLKSYKGVDKDRQNFAKALSLKYQKYGRPARGFIGLAVEGETPSSTPSVPDQPVSGSLLFNAFNRLKNELNSI